MEIENKNIKEIESIITDEIDNSNNIINNNNNGNINEHIINIQNEKKFELVELNPKFLKSPTMIVLALVLGVFSLVGLIFIIYFSIKK
ncbi:hypothetical protein DDB_G0287489 [Dictyostelium discoideum AX4]|uniref:Putative uncharacterized protein DDB_G0287489 n=1 Tax=Dictyostelium discoideum TaxID=44689 RepID=Y1923_DICDI|nr:hypothetical protein DDB_G0287489 [Dictyostelium discoideum AX4]Q54KB9.1 RecName: Full=Putative uncharacterized protein DDB_G0287489 [Dictyostelium discoideum]EAL63710.1 hypothetical protein DDB_G0287489 [Dictyostelium discoideum AX4]|eukprot:XP_637202.1 hypothetical protein DDB_G0287489 [Dictyostelium discoideum AX4]